ncbi:MAG: thiol:disulfide interchange protein DsbA/DsbL [Candidatus Endonucleobacter bathymodioli]|uniref:Thiol:disulfide interchange protein DsbA n=1 Tax=Candidatus Endonucleibacter bathymodioli TaxID=539814 RepID=A0AA90NPJ9_9GAMM|nr:thiol:disulfide interchange protein DsbA/DsbL [Candidatus Endonucleobacter bathymodioli]
MPIIAKLLWLLLFCSLTVSADEEAKVTGEPSAELKQLSPDYKEGEDYRVLKTPEKHDATAIQIVVAEVFWYGCPHCYTLEGIASSWEQTLPKDVKFIRVPAFFGPNIWKNHANLYYTIQNMGIVDKVHYGIFDEIQNKKNYLENSGKMSAFLKSKFKVDKNKFLKTYKSLKVTHQLMEASTRTRAYGITGVPALVVGGQYIVEPGLAQSLEKMTDITDYLIAKIRRDRDKKT